MSTTENLRKPHEEVRKLDVAAGELSNDELATVTGGGTTVIVCDPHKVIGTRPK
jgi:bacteriocin-like protein